MRLSLICAALATGLLATACQPVRDPAPTAAPVVATAPASAVPADDNLNAVLWVQRSAEYRAAAAQTYRAATGHLDAALKQADWDALVPEERGNPAGGLKPAVILDIDETVLDTRPTRRAWSATAPSTAIRPGTPGSRNARPGPCRASSSSPAPPTPAASPWSTSPTAPCT